MWSQNESSGRDAGNNYRDIEADLTGRARLVDSEETN